MRPASTNYLLVGVAPSPSANDIPWNRDNRVVRGVHEVVIPGKLLLKNKDIMKCSGKTRASRSRRTYVSNETTLSQILGWNLTRNCIFSALENDVYRSLSS